VQDRIVVKNNDAIVTLQANDSGTIGTNYGMNLINTSDTDFVIQSDYSGGVVFKQLGGTTDTNITQGTIVLTDLTDTNITTIDPTLLSFSDGVDTTTFNQTGVTTTSDLTLDIGTNLLFTGTITENTAGGFTGQYLKVIINGTTYKLQLLAD
jgi:hypothetical protein